MTEESQYKKPSRFARLLATQSQSLNVLLFDGHEDEMLSARAHRESWPLQFFLDSVFFWQKNHCLECHKWELERNASKEWNL